MGMTFGLPHTVILDDGELAEIRTMLGEAGIPFVDEIPEGRTPERAIPLLVTTPRRARALTDSVEGAGLPPNYLHLVVSEAEDASTGDLLVGVPCDFVIQRPIDPDVLRLLTQRAGYEGPERRRMLRVAIGAAIELQVDGETCAAQLAQLSIGGCGLVVSEEIDEDALLSIDFPRALTEPRELSLQGHVLSVREIPGSGGKNYDISVTFDPIPLTDRVTLRSVMAGQPIDFRPRPSLRVDPGPPAVAAYSPRRRRSVVPVSGDRRKRPRRIYNRQILGGTEGIARVLIGRDISTRGMRVERGALFELGHEIKLAIYGGMGVSPVLLKAVVERDDGDAGWFLQFAELSEAVESDLTELLESLPPIGTADGAGSILTEVLESE